MMDGNFVNNVIDFDDNTLVLPVKPVKPSESDCCGQGCIPCVFDVYEQELKIWEEECRKIALGRDSENSEHMIGYTWRPVYFVEEEPGKNHDPREAAGKLSHIPTLAEPETRTNADSGEMSVICKGERFRPPGAPQINVREGGPVLKPMEYSVFVVQSLKQETKDSYRFRISLPPGATLGMVIGQHLIIRGMVGEELVTRQYTPITNVQQKSYFDLLIKVYPEGKMSKYVSTWKVGTKVEMRGPYGNFTYRPNQHRHLFMLAAGTGITPISQVVQGILDNPDDETFIHLLYSCVTYSSILLKPEIDEWGKFWNFSVLFFLSYEQDTGNYKYRYRERIHQSRLDFACLQKEMGQFVDCCFVLICGTQSFEKDMIEHVTNLKVPKSNIFKF